MKKTLASLLAAGMIATTLAGCGGGAPADDGGQTSGGDTSGGGDEQVVLKLITAKDYLAKLQPYIDAFETANPNIDVQAEESPNADINSKINMAHASEDDYDLMWIDGAQFPQFVGGGVLEPLDSYLEGSEVDLAANYNPAITEAAIVEGSTYGVSVAPGTRVLAYNKNLLAEHGLEVPTTQEEILSHAKTVYEATGGEVYGYVRQFDNPVSPLYNEGGFFMSNGARLAEDNGDGTYTAVANSQEMIDSLAWFTEFTKYMPADVNTSGTEVREMFGQGRSLFYVFGPWEYNLIPGMTYGEDFDLMTIPGPEQVATLGGWYLGIGAGSEQKDAAWLFMETYLNDPEMMAECSLTLPGDLRAYEYAPFNDPKYIPYAETMENCELPMPIHVQSAKVAQAFKDGFDEVLVAGADAQTTMDAVNAEIQELLDDK